MTPCPICKGSRQVWAPGCPTSPEMAGYERVRCYGFPWAHRAALGPLPKCTGVRYPDAARWTLDTLACEPGRADPAPVSGVINAR